MRIYFNLVLIWMCSVVLACGYADDGSGVDSYWIHPVAKKLPLVHSGPFIVLDSGNLLRISGGYVMVSDDEGETWKKQAKIYDGPPPGIPRRGGLLAKGANGTIIFAYEDRDNFKREWDKEKREFTADSRRHIWVIRSLDGGNTWIDRQRLFDGYGATFINFIYSSLGSFVLPVQGLVVNRERHSMFTYSSFDAGKTWQKSNVIDLGGTGHHEGALEGTIGQLSNDELWMLIRTNLDQFWSAYSADGGKFWRKIEPSGIDASSSPGFLLRLEDKSLVLVWNRLYPEGMSSVDRLVGDGQKTTYPSSYHRSELSISLSRNDGLSWEDPVVIARTKSKKGIAYPDVIERYPGEIWITTRYPKSPRVRISLKVSDLFPFNFDEEL